MNKKLILTAAVLGAIAGTSFAEGSLILAQVSGGGGNLDSALGKVMGIISKIFYVIAFVALGGAGYKFMKGDTDQAKMSFVGAAVIALAGYIVGAIFTAAGNPINIQVQ